MALAVFSRAQRHPSAAAEAREQYGRLLQIARVSMPELAQNDVDAALLAIFLMSRFEDATHAAMDLSSDPVFASYQHHDGATAILKLWQERRLGPGQPATAVIKHSRRGIIKSAFLRHTAVPAGLEDGGQFGEFGLELEYDRLLVGIASIRQQLREIQQEMFHREVLSPDLAAGAQDMNVEAHVLSKALQDWSCRVPSNWQPRRHLIPAHHSVPRDHFFSSIVYSYPSIAYGAIWMNYYATSMLFHRSRLRILELFRPFSDDLTGEQQRQEEFCCSQIRDMANALSYTMPFALDRFSVTESSKSPGGGEVTLKVEEDVKPYLGNLTAWPLSLAASIGGLDIKLRDWFRSELVSVGKATGSSVLEHAHTYEWLDL